MSSSVSRRIIKVGSSASKKFTIRSEDVIAFGNIIEDHNPIHSDSDAAKAAGFPRTICHGMFAGSLFSGLMATEIPGPNTIYLSQNLNFKAPIFVGDEVEVSVEVTQFRRSKGLVAMRTVIQKEDLQTGRQVVCIEGTALGLNKEAEFEGESEWKFSK
ncbi:unnamed protein product [Phytomonas sp. Hart1]|nr:unnamed protein product [Phytomonas sp. Hart1]|eukprot:CCW72083.1 unnamed protein product [Phytomonas sp. isolate Hart1]